jgi:hypothetical protein
MLQKNSLVRIIMSSLINCQIRIWGLDAFSDERECKTARGVMESGIAGMAYTLAYNGYKIRLVR